MKRLIPALLLATFATMTLSAPSEAGGLRPQFIVDEHGNLLQTYDDDGMMPRRCFKHRVMIEDDLGYVTWRWTKDCEGRKRPIRYQRPRLPNDPPILVRAGEKPEGRSAPSGSEQGGDKDADTPSVR